MTIGYRNGVYVAGFHSVIVLRAMEGPSRSVDVGMHRHVRLLRTGSRGARVRSHTMEY